MSVEVARKSHDGLSDQVWVFSISSSIGSYIVMRLQSYQERARATSRHKMKAVRGWYRIDQRAYHSQIHASDVPIPSDVIAEARHRVQVVFEPLTQGDKNEARTAGV